MVSTLNKTVEKIPKAWRRENKMLQAWLCVSYYIVGTVGPDPQFGPSNFKDLILYNIP